MATQKLIQTIRNGKVQNTLSGLPRGSNGVRDTLLAMRESVMAMLVHPLIIQLARSIVANVAGHDYRAEAEAVQEWVKANIRYSRDPVGAELLQTPQVTLRKRQGDCDDHASLVAALLGALGHKMRLVAVGFAPGQYAHVYAEDFLSSQWLPVETTEPWPLGKGPSGIVSRMTAYLPGAGPQEVAGFFKSLVKRIGNSHTKPFQFVKNPSKVTKKELVTLKDSFGGFSQGLQTGNIYAAVAGAAITSTAAAAGRDKAAEIGRKEQAEYEAAVRENEAANLALEKAQAAGLPIASITPIAAPGIAATNTATGQAITATLLPAGSTYDAAGNRTGSSWMADLEEMAAALKTIPKPYLYGGAALALLLLARR